MARDLGLIMGGRPCTRNFYSNGPMRVAQVRRNGDQNCPFYDDCPVGESPDGGTSCLMVVGAEVAVEAIATGVPVASIVNNKVLPELVRGRRVVRFAWSPDRAKLEILNAETDAKKILESIRDFAVLVLEGTLENEGAAYDVPVQAAAPAQQLELILVRSSDGKTEIAFYEE